MCSDSEKVDFHMQYMDFRRLCATTSALPDNIYEWYQQRVGEHAQLQTAAQVQQRQAPLQTAAQGQQGGRRQGLVPLPCTRFAVRAGNSKQNV